MPQDGKSYRRLIRPTTAPRQPAICTLSSNRERWITILSARVPGGCSPHAPSRTRSHPVRRWCRHQCGICGSCARTDNHVVLNDPLVVGQQVQDRVREDVHAIADAYRPCESPMIFTPAPMPVATEPPYTIDVNGRLTVTVEPTPSVLSIETVPPRLATMCWTPFRPSPVPWKRPVTLLAR